MEKKGKRREREGAKRPLYRDLLSHEINKFNTSIKTHHHALAVDDGEARDALADEEVERWRLLVLFLSGERSSRSEKKYEARPATALAGISIEGKKTNTRIAPSSTVVSAVTVETPLVMMSATVLFLGGSFSAVAEEAEARRRGGRLSCWRRRRQQQSSDVVVVVVAPACVCV